MLDQEQDQRMTEEERATLRFLKSQVNRLQDESFRLPRHPNVQQDLYRARQELKEFVNILRMDGAKI